MPLPRDILEHAERVLDYHRQSKLDNKSRAIPIDLKTRPASTRLFDQAPLTPLSPSLIDLPSPVLPLLEKGLDAVPESQHAPPHDLRTLSTWLHMAAGLRQKVTRPWGVVRLRGTPSTDDSFPAEIYVAAFAITGLTAGLYHFSVREHALRKLRDGPETLSMLRRGRPDLHFLGTTPGALLVSTLFCRSTWQHGRRGYRHALLDAGHLVANLQAAGAGVGIHTMSRLRMTDSCMRELIGLPEGMGYPIAESVQAMVVWADEAAAPIDGTKRPPPGTLPLIPRPPGDEGVVAYGSVLAVQADTVARGVAVREIRPPLTDLTPVPRTVAMARMPVVADEMPSKSIRTVLMEPRNVEHFHRKSISRDAMMLLARCAFRGGTSWPLKPDGPHLALVRPFFVIHDVTGQDPGIWWYDPVIDKWAHLNHGQYREQMPMLCRGREMLEDATFHCVMVANIRKLVTEAGPDLYRMAHLEAGIAAQRLNLAASSIGMACRTFGDFCDDHWKMFLGLGTTGWEPLAVCAVGGVGGPGEAAVGEARATVSLEFRD